MVKKSIFLLVIIADIMISAIVYASNVNNELSKNLLRMHIISNSNQEADIKIKNMVRDKVIRIIRDSNYKDKSEVICDLRNTEKQLNEYLKSLSKDFKLTVRYCISDFPQKKYNNLVMPSGKYECIKIVIGEGKGENWWCIAYPPLCFTQKVLGELDEKGEKELYEKLPDELYSMIHLQDTEYVIKFKTVDILNSLLLKLENYIKNGEISKY